MGVTIIANNCCGSFLMRDMGLEYNSPTTLTHIMPEEYLKFCLNLKDYLKCDLKEYKEVSDYHKEILSRFYGKTMNDFPRGLLGDICVMFQHEPDFESAKMRWKRHIARMDWDNLNFLFCVKFELHKNLAIEFAKSDLPNKVIFTREFDIDYPHYRYSVPEGQMFLATDRPHHFLFEGDWDRKLLKGV